MLNIDRRDDEMPTQGMAMRYESIYPRKSSYATPDNFIPSSATQPLGGIQSALSENIQKPTETTPLNRFCGGMSKPYKK